MSLLESRTVSQSVGVVVCEVPPCAAPRRALALGSAAVPEPHQPGAPNHCRKLVLRLGTLAAESNGLGIGLGSGSRVRAPVAWAPPWAAAAPVRGMRSWLAVAVRGCISHLGHLPSGVERRVVAAGGGVVVALQEVLPAPPAVELHGRALERGATLGVAPHRSGRPRGRGQRTPRVIGTFRHVGGLVLA
jgi:hypothetical protein